MDEKQKLNSYKSGRAIKHMYANRKVEYGSRDYRKPTNVRTSDMEETTDCNRLKTLEFFHYRKRTLQTNSASRNENFFSTGTQCKLLIKGSQRKDVAIRRKFNNSHR